MRTIVLTNDDGIDAAGLAALATAAAGLGRLVTVAPAREWSGASHQVTTTGAIAVERLAPERFVVHGSPADCVRVALEQLVPDADWVLSGINHGGNLGVDVYHSGTVAAAREAAIHGRQAVAVSHYRRRGVAVDWPRAARWIAPLLAELIAAPLDPGGFRNVNLPHPPPDAAPPPVARCDLDPSPLPLRFALDGDAVRYDGDYHQRARRPGLDIERCFAGAITVSTLRVA